MVIGIVISKIMKIDFNKKQFKELLLLVSLGAYIKGGVEDQKGRHYDDNELTSYLLSHAEEMGLGNLVEKFKGKLIQSDELSDEVEKMMENYDEEEFWQNLITNLGKRDFMREVSEEELAEIRKDKFGWLPKRIQDYYAKYEKEFEKYGVDRLEIKE